MKLSSFFATLSAVANPQPDGGSRGTAPGPPPPGTGEGLSLNPNRSSGTVKTPISPIQET